MVEKAPNFEIQSDLTFQELADLAGRLNNRFPKMYDVLKNPCRNDSDLFERASVGLTKYLRENEEDICGKERSRVIKVQKDLVYYLAGWLSEKTEQRKS